MSRLRLELAICALLCAVAGAAFHPVGSFGFVDFDDPDYVLENPIVNRGLDGEALRLAFTRVQSNNWHPLTWISHMLDVSLFGVDAPPMHLMNLLLHALNACLLFLVLHRMTGAPGPSAFVGALFAVHPAHVESVAWISQRKDTLSTFFWLLGMGAWARYARLPGSPSRYALVCGILVLGLLSKPMLVTLPFVFLLLDYWPLGRVRLGRVPLDGVPLDGVRPGEGEPGESARRLRGLVVEKLPLLAIAAAASVVTFLVQRGSGAMKSAELFGPAERLAGALLATVRYLRMLVWPEGLSAFYPRGSPEQLGAVGPLLLAALLLLALTALAFLRARAQPYLLVGWLWFLGTLVPVIGLVQVGDQALADRYTYVPYVGLFIAVAWAADDLLPRLPGGGRTLAMVGAALVLACTALSWRQVGTWRDAESLWTRALEVTPDNATAHVHLGNLLGAKGRHDEELHHFREAVRLLPGAAAVRHNLGTALARRDELAEARSNFEAALRINPKLAESQLALADVLGRQGEFHVSVSLYVAALDAKPDLFSLPAVQQGYASALLGDARGPHATFEDASASHRLALARHPAWHTAANNLAWILATDPRATPDHGRAAVEVAARSSRALGDGSPQLLDTLAAAQAAAGRFDEAISSAERAAALADRAGRADLAQAIRERQARYRAGERIVEDHSR